MLTFSEYIKVGIADLKTGKSPEGLVTLGLGSCVGICMYDSIRRIGGLAHIMLPDSSEFHVDGDLVYKYADTAVPELVNELVSKGASKYALKAVIIGGGNMFSNSPQAVSQGVGRKNQDAVITSLSKLNIPVVASELGGTSGKTVFFELEFGDVYIKKGINIEKFYTFTKK